MKITITGISGFVGKNLSEFLMSEGLDVTGLSLRGNWSFPKNADAVIHLAGKAHDTSNTSDAEEYFKINRDLTIQLFDDFLKSDCKDFFYFSTVKAVADTLDETLIENYSPDPKTPYGKSKLEAENYLLKQNLPFGKRLFIIRPCMIHGTGNKGNLNLLYKIVEKGLPWPLASFHNERSFLSIDNLNFLILRMLEKPNTESGIYNFSDDYPISTNQLVSLISDSFGRKNSLMKFPKSVITTFAKIGDILHLPINSERLRKLTENYVVSNSKIKKELGMEKLPFNTEEGLTKTIKSFRS